MKKNVVFTINLFVGLLMLLFASYIQAQEISVKVTGIRSPKGNIIINVFKDQESYDKELPFKKISFDKKSLDKGSLIVKFNLEPGIYGITLLDDENGNGKIDKSILQMPKEGFGFSNFFMEKMKKPLFNDFKVDTKTKPNVDVRVKYM